MKWLIALVIGAALSIDTVQADFLLIPKHTPQPSYPGALAGTLRSGRVTVRYTVRADGAVINLVVVDSTHSEFTREVRRVMAEWLYHPWAVDGEHPQTIDIRLPFIFMGVRDGASHREWTALSNPRCAEVLQELVMPADNELQMASFAQVRKALNQAFAFGRISYEQHRALVARLEGRWSTVMAACELEPDRHVIDFMPEMAVAWAPADAG